MVFISIVDIRNRGNPGSSLSLGKFLHLFLVAGTAYQVAKKNHAKIAYLSRSCFGGDDWWFCIQRFLRVLYTNRAQKNPRYYMVTLRKLPQKRRAFRVGDFQGNSPRAASRLPLCARVASFLPSYSPGKRTQKHMVPKSTIFFSWQIPIKNKGGFSRQLCLFAGVCRWSLPSDKQKKDPKVHTFLWCLFFRINQPHPNVPPS